MVAENDKMTIIPRPMAELEWVWVLSSSMSKDRDSIFVIDMDEKENGQRRRVVPIFENRAAAETLKHKLCPAPFEAAGALKHIIPAEPRREYSEQAMRLADVGVFAAKHDLEIMILDGTGAILAHMEAKMERMTVH